MIKDEAIIDNNKNESTFVMPDTCFDHSDHGSQKDERELIDYYNFIKNWDSKEKCLDFAVRIDAWLAQFEDTEKQLMLDILKKFSYYNKQLLQKKVAELYKKFKEEHNEEYILSQIQKDYGVGYSDYIYDDFWMVNNLKDYAERNILDLVERDDLEEIPCLVLVDDYTGTGKTFIDFYKKLLSINPGLGEKTTFFLTVASSSVAIENINSFAKEGGYDIHLICLEEQKRAFLDNFLYVEEDSNNKRCNYEAICKKHHVKCIFGFGDVEGLISFEYNTPNNTLGIIWNDSSEYSGLFKRHKREETTLKMIQERARVRKIIKMHKPVINNIDDPKTNIFLAYCVIMGEGYSTAKACEDFGLSATRLDELMDMALYKEYISMESGYPEATSKLKMEMSTSRKLISEFRRLINNLEKTEEEKVCNDNYIPQQFSTKRR